MNNDALTRRLPAWMLRFTLGAAYLTLGDVMLWDHPALEGWALRLLACILLAALTLDILVRFRVRDLAGLVLTGGLFGITYGVLAAQAVGSDILDVVPRPLGWYSLVGGGLGLALMLVLWRGAVFTPLRAGAAGAVGLAWGIWVRWFPLQEAGSQAPALLHMLLAGAAALAAVGALAYLAWRLSDRIHNEHYLLLERWEWAVFGAGMAALAGAALGEGGLSPVGVAALVLFDTFIIGVLYFMRTRYRRSILHQMIPLQPPKLPHYAGMALGFLAAAAVGYLIPPLGGGDAAPSQLTALTTLLYIGGFLWLPAATIVMAVWAFIDLSRSGF